jgi:hypothetical protein
MRTAVLRLQTMKCSNFGKTELQQNAGQYDKI